MRFFWPLLLLPLCYSSLRAQDSTRYFFRHISTTEGLSSTYARKIVQDPYGFLWIGTQDGLNRYDGKSFWIYNMGIGGSRDITGSDIRSLCLDTARHLIWAVTSFKGIDAIDYRTGLPVIVFPRQRTANWPKSCSPRSPWREGVFSLAAPRVCSTWTAWARHPATCPWPIHPT